MRLFFAAIIASLFIPLSQSTAEEAPELEGTYLYKVTTIRAERGKFSDLLDWFAEMKTSDYYQKSEPAPFIMRHSQGDQWDLMIMTPMKNWADFYSKAKVRKRAKAQAAFAAQLAQADSLIAFSEDNFAEGPSLSALQTAYDQNGFYHIEMFEAAAGKKQALIEQRRMENNYLAATAQKPNMIFRSVAGSDVDAFTIGFHESLEAFATQGEGTDEEREAAAKAAGFKDRADLSFYLRSLITGHHDTLAGKVE